MCMLSGLSKCELHRGCPIVHEEHEERSHENTIQSITQELFFRLTNSENVPVQTWELSAANRYTTARAASQALLDLPAVLTRLLATNFYAPANLVREMLPTMRTGNPGPATNMPTYTFSSVR